MHPRCGTEVLAGAALTALGLKADADVVDIVFHEYDADRSGSLQYTEFVRYALRDGLKRCAMRVMDLLRKWDADGSNTVDRREFRKAIKMIGGLGLTDTEIDRLMQRVDADQDGQVSYQEFAAKFRDDPDFDTRMVKRANDRLAEFKEKMILYMTSSTDAYKLVSELLFSKYD